MGGTIDYVCEGDTITTSLSILDCIIYWQAIRIAVQITSNCRKHQLKAVPLWKFGQPLDSFIHHNKSFLIEDFYNCSVDNWLLLLILKWWVLLNIKTIILIWHTWNILRGSHEPYSSCCLFYTVFIDSSFPKVLRLFLETRVVFKSGVIQIFETNQNVVIWLVKWFDLTWKWLHGIWFESTYWFDLWFLFSPQIRKTFFLACNLLQ